MKTWLLVALLLLLPAGEALASACCVLAAPGRSGRLPEKEVFGTLLSYGFESQPGVWTAQGDLHFAQSDLQLTHSLTPQVMVRPNRVFQASLALPLMLNTHRIADEVSVGGGPGDLEITARFEPIAVGGWLKAPPLPGLGLSLTLPTGTPTHRAATGTAVTGTGYMALSPFFSLDKALDRGAFGVDVSGTFSLPRPGDETRTLPGIGFAGSLFGAFYASTKATVTATIGLRGSSAGWRGGKSSGGPQLEPIGGVGLVLEPRKLSRLVLGMQGSVPIPKLGLRRAVSVSFNLGWQWSAARKVATSGSRAGGV